MRIRSRKKKRSLRGKIFLCMAYLIACCIVIIIFKFMSTLVLPKEKTVDNVVVNTIENMNTKDAESSVEAIGSEGTVILENPNSKPEGNTVAEDKDGKVTVEKDYDKEKKFIGEIMSLIVSIPYIKGGRCFIDGKGNIETKGLDSFGIVDYSYARATGKHLADAGITEDTLSKCKEITSDTLHIGDIGICKLDNTVVYGVYVGNYGSYPLFVYACDLSNGIYESGSAYISYNKNECNDLFAGMYPMAYNKFYRLPDMNYQEAAGGDITDSLPADIIPSKEYSEYASAVYRIGEWFRTKDSESLIAQMNEIALNDKGYLLDTNAFKAYVDSYDGDTDNGNYIFRILSYTIFSEYTTVHAEVISVNNTERTFMDSGTYFDCTIYEEGNYLPGSVPVIEKYSTIYGFTLQEGNNNEYFTENNTDITVVPGITGTPAEENGDEHYMKGNGFSIDLDEVKGEINK